MPAAQARRIGHWIDWLLATLLVLMVVAIAAEFHTSDVPGLIVDVLGTATAAVLLVLRRQHRRAVNRLESGRAEMARQIDELRSTYAEFENTVNRRLDELNVKVVLEELDP